MTSEPTSAPFLADMQLDPERLFSIDVNAEFQHVALEQSEAPWELPMELMRDALRRGATEVSIALSATELCLRDDGLGLSHEALSDLASLLAPLTNPEQRHGALLRLEAGRQNGLLLLAWLGPRRIEIRSRNGPRLTRHGKSQPAIGTCAAASNQIEVRVTLNTGQAGARLKTSAVFAPGRIELNGRLLPKWEPNAFASAALTAPVPGRLYLHRSGDEACVFLLLDGVLSARLTVAGAPPFVAVAEMRDLAPFPSSAALLRERIEPHLDSLSAQAFELLLTQGRRIRALAEPDQRRVRRCLLTTARQRHALGPIYSLRMFRATAEPGASERWLALADLGDAKRIQAVFPDQLRRHKASGSGPALVLDGEERSLLADLLGLHFAPPPEPPTPEAGLTALGRRIRRAWGSFPLGRLMSPRPLPVAALSPAERHLLAALRQTIRQPSVDFCLCPGSGRVRRLGGSPRSRFLIPRDSPLTRSAVRAWERSQDFLPLIALALLGDWPEAVEHLRTSARAASDAPSNPQPQSSSPPQIDNMSR